MKKLPDEVLGRCELCGNSRRRVHRETPNRFVAPDQGFVFVCRRCGRMNTAIKEGRAITCTELDARAFGRPRP